VSRPHRQQWTREEILEAGLAWAEHFEEPPASPEWGAALGKRIARAEAKLASLRAKRNFHKGQRMPGVAAVRQHFGDWPTFIAALGFQARAGGGGRPTNKERAEGRRIARELTELGPIHIRLMHLIQRGGLRIAEDELNRQAIRSDLPDGWGDDLEDLVASGLVERATVYRLTDRGRQALAAAASDAGGPDRLDGHAETSDRARFGAYPGTA
jgi:hypothetical protein